jgi:hypothetical protein
VADVWLCYDHLVVDNAHLQLLSPKDAVAELLAPLEGGADGLLIWEALDKNHSVLDERACDERVSLSCCGADHSCHLRELLLLCLLLVTTAGAAGLALVKAYPIARLDTV